MLRFQFKLYKKQEEFERIEISYAVQAKQLKSIHQPKPSGLQMTKVQVDLQGSRGEVIVISSALSQTTTSRSTTSQRTAHSRLNPSLNGPAVQRNFAPELYCHRFR